jgi:hypothetical protein
MARDFGASSAIIHEDNYARICLNLEVAASYENGGSEVRRTIQVFEEVGPDAKKLSFRFARS